MPPCAPPYYPGTQRNPHSDNRKISTAPMRRVIFPSFYQNGINISVSGAASVDTFSEYDDPEMTTKVPEVKTKENMISSPPGTSPAASKSRHNCSLYSSSTTVRTLHLPSLQTMELPEGATPPRKSTLRSVPARRSILRRYQTPVPANLLSEPKTTATSLPKGELVSILRNSSFGNKGTGSNSLPSLQSLQEGEDSTNQLQGSSMRRSTSEPGRSATKQRMIQFDPQVWIREFERSPEEQACTWYGDDDMERFKRHALALVMARDRLMAAREGSEILGTGTTRTLSRNNKRGKGAAFYTHAALTLDGEAYSSSSSSADAAAVLTKALQNDRYRAVVAQQEMKSVLLVDPHDICITLFRKAFTTLFPKVEIVAASSSAEALESIANHPPFDVILVEERLQPLLSLHKQKSMSGSGLFRSLATISKDECKTREQKRSAALWIGVSAYLAKDRASLEASGADICWGKPPPTMSDALRNQMLQALLMKRGQSDFCQELFGTTSS